MSTIRQTPPVQAGITCSPSFKRAAKYGLIATVAIGAIVGTAALFVLHPSLGHHAVTWITTHKGIVIGSAAALLVVAYTAAKVYEHRQSKLVPPERVDHPAAPPSGITRQNGHTDEPRADTSRSAAARNPVADRPLRKHPYSNSRYPTTPRDPTVKILPYDDKTYLDPDERGSHTVRMRPGCTGIDAVPNLPPVIRTTGLAQTNLYIKNRTALHKIAALALAAGSRDPIAG